MADTKHTVLVIEDERPLLKAIKTKLENNDFEVVTARRVEEALKYLKDRADIEVIWLDHYLLGQENGLSLLANLKQEEGKWKEIPVFIVSNTAGAQTVQSYLRLGVEKYFTKADNRLDDIVEDIVTHLSTGEQS